MGKKTEKKECTVKLTCSYKTPIPYLKTSVFKKKKKTQSFPRAQIPLKIFLVSLPQMELPRP